MLSAKNLRLAMVTITVLGCGGFTSRASAQPSPTPTATPVSGCCLFEGASCFDDVSETACGPFPFSANGTCANGCESAVTGCCVTSSCSNGVPEGSCTGSFGAFESSGSPNGCVPTGCCKFGTVSCFDNFVASQCTDGPPLAPAEFVEGGVCGEGCAAPTTVPTPTATATPPIPTGCCLIDGGLSCFDGVSQTACGTNPFSPNDTCANGCAGATSGCCVVDSTCSDNVPESACSGSFGAFETCGSGCAPTGCCRFGSVSCLDNTVESNCDSPSFPPGPGEFIEGGACGNGCFTPTPTPTATPKVPLITMGQAGSSTVMGFGLPNETDCIQIFDCGPDHICGGPGDTDDILLNPTPGSTDASGKFTITLNAPLRCREELFARDICQTPPVDGPAFVVFCIPAVPLLSPSMLLVLAGALTLVGLLALARMRLT